MWSAVTSPTDTALPSSRSKHSATLLGGHVYLLGGRNGNLPLKDFWRYSLAESCWELLQPTGDRPPCLQEHTAVAHRDSIYVFGGELGFSAGTETPLWVFHVKSNSWRKVRVQKGVTVPKGRRGHTAMVHKGSMLIYGGYQDLRGSSNELWAFHFDTESWHLLSSAKGRSNSELPPARHKHSAVLHDDAIWVYGGMTDLQERADLWRWDTVSKVWSTIKSKPCPGPLHSHAACKLPSSMLIFGGERDGHPTNELWRFHFGTNTWERLNIGGPRPQPCAEGVALAVSELLLRDPLVTTTPATPPVITPQPRASSVPRHHGANRVSPCERKYVFRPTSVNYVDGSREETMARRSLQQTPLSAQTPGGNNSFLKEITKLSQMNLSRLSHHNCSYSVLTSKEDSTSSESLHRQNGEKQTEENEPEGTPKLVKSQSASVITRRRMLSASPDAPPLTSILRNHNGYRNHTTLRTPTEKIARDPMSMPNFGEIPSLPTPVLTPIEITRLVFLESDDDADDDAFEKSAEQTFSVLHQQFQPPSRRSESYTSHLLAAGDQDAQRAIPKSASVRFRKEHSVVEIEDLDEASTSDYASNENVHRITSVSNYSISKQCPDTPNNEYPNVKVRKNNRKDGPFGFSNPNYLGPDIQSILSNNRKTWHVTTPTDIENFAKVLNSPPDSLLEDVNGRSISRQFYQEEMMEMQSLDAARRMSPGSCHGAATRRPPHFLALAGTNQPMSVDKRKKSRAKSAGRDGEAHQTSCLSSARESPAQMYVFVLGGKEKSQVTVYKKPFAVWRLQLAANVY